MFTKLKRLYSTTEILLKICFLLHWYFVRTIITAFRVPREEKPVSRVVIVQFAPRAGVVGGDSVVNGYVSELLGRSGVPVEVRHYPSVRSGAGLTKWLFGDLWFQAQTLRKQLKRERVTILIDSQLSLGVFWQPTVCICHYSFWGYTKLATKGMDLLGYLYSFRNSLAQAFGTLGTTVIAVSEFQARFLRKEGVLVHRVIPNVQLLSSLTGKGSVAHVGNRKDFVFLGGYSYFGKGFDILEELASTGWTIDCYTNHVGPGPLRYCPFVPHDKILQVLEKYAILVHPSRYESCSMAVLEALSCGLPVLISNVGIGPELRKYIPEFVVTTTGPQGIAEYQAKARAILADYGAFSNLARDYVARFHSWSDFESAWRGVFHLEATRP